MPRPKGEGSFVHSLAGQVIGHAECSGCGATVPVKVNKNGCAYYWCMARRESGNKCMKRENWGIDDSREMIREFEQAKEEGHDETESDNIEAEGGSETDDAPAQSDSGNIFAW